MPSDPEQVRFSTAGDGLRLRWILLASVCLVVLVAACYSQVRHFGYVNIDDPVYASENQHVRLGLSLKGAIWAFTTFEGANWHPMTWLSLMADTSIFGPGPEGHHITNVLLHLANTLLLFIVFSQMTGAPKKSAVLAALFAVHPLHVESVAWISERKDVLSTFFGLLSIASYVRYAKGGRRLAYTMSMLFLCLGLMAKPLLVTWPCLFLLLDYWPLMRIKVRAVEGTGGLPGPGLRARGPVLEKLPLLVPVVLISASTLMAQHFSGAIIPAGALDLATRLENALVSYAGYLVKAFWPTDLSVFYPYRDPASLFWPAAGAALLLLLITAGTLGLARKAPYLPVGWFWFLGTLVPMIGLVQVGTQAMADRYMYVPLIGLGIACVWGVDDLWRRTGKDRRLPAVLAAAILAALSFCTYRQTAYWESSLTLFAHAVAVDPENDLAHNNLGAAYAGRGEAKKAERQYRRALDLNPWNGSAASNLAKRLSDRGDFDEAETLYRRAIKIDPKWAPFRYNYGVLLFRTGRTDEAIAQFAEALKRNPNMAKVYNYMGVALARQGELERAVAFFSRALQVDPTFTPALNNLKRWRLQKGGAP